MRYSKLDCEPVPHDAFENWKAELFTSFFAAALTVGFVYGVGIAFDLMKGKPIEFPGPLNLLYLATFTVVFYGVDLLNDWARWKSETYSFEEMTVERFDRMARWAERSFVAIPRSRHPIDAALGISSAEAAVVDQSSNDS